jgi:adenine deaminase
LTFSPIKNNLKDRIAVARGLRKADLVLKGGQIVNVFSGEIYSADVAIHKGTIAGLGEYEGEEVIDAASKLILPGLIRTHPGPDRDETFGAAGLRTERFCVLGHGERHS